jgi:hypothetical protein
VNNRAFLKRVEVALDETQFVETLVAGFTREPQGLKTSTDMVRLLIIGLILSIKEQHTATITGAYVALTEHMEARDQLRLGVKIGEGPRDFIKRDRLYYAAELLVTKLDYGASVTGLLEEVEIERRFSALFVASNTLLDFAASATKFNDTVLALDATAVWSWRRGKYYPKPTAAEIAAQSDEIIKQSLIDLAGGVGNISDLEDAKITDDPARLEGLDPDAAWSGATAKNGGTKRFYGQYAHTLVSVPTARIEDDPSTEVPLIRRVIVTKSTDDVVQPSLTMLDSLDGLSTNPRQPNRLLVDRHYSYKEMARWQSPLIERNIRQGLDLRSDEYKMTYYNNAIFFAGDGYCRWTEPAMFEPRRPGVFATSDEHKQYQAHRDVATLRAFARVSAMDKDGNIRLTCPARAFKVACPLFPPSMAVAAEQGLDIINPQFQTLDPDAPLPKCCTQETFSIKMPEQAAKLYQPDMFGTTQWAQVYRGRTYVEGSYGNLKNPRTENLRRGSIQKSGIVWSQLILTLMAFVYNERLIRGRHARMGGEFSGHALLTPDSESVTHVSLTEVQEREIFDDFMAGINIEDLEVKTSTRLKSKSSENRRDVPSPAPIPIRMTLQVWSTSTSSSGMNGAVRTKIGS